MLHRTVFLFTLVVFGLQFSLQTTEPVYKKREPSKKNSRPPLLLVLHGYASNEDDLFDLATTLDERLMVVCLRAPLSLDDGGYCWYKLGRDKENRLTYNYEEAVVSRKLVKRFISTTCSKFQLDSSAVFLMGFSQGAMLSYDIALAYPGKIKGVLALSGRLMEQSASLQTNWNELRHTSFFIGHGTNDNRIPLNEAEKARDFLVSKGLKTIDYKTYPMQHVLNGQEILDIRNWLSRKLSEKQEPVKKPNPATPAKK